jgi:Tfp pilus assembly protein PilO
MALNKRERTLLIATIAAAVVAGNYLAIAPLLRSWQSIGRKLITQRRELEGVKATIAHEPEWQQQYTALGHSLKQSESFEQTSDVLKKIEEVGATSGILIQSRRPMRAEDKDVYRELPVQCTFESTAESLVKFLYGLQTASGFMRVESLNVTAKPDNPSILRCDIQIRALAAKSEKPLS